jgi:hypothetical protein
MAHHSGIFFHTQVVFETNTIVLVLLAREIAQVATVTWP